MSRVELLLRRQQLERAWAAFLQQRNSPRLRGSILSSWMRCVRQGVDPHTRAAPVAAPPEEVERTWKQTSLYQAVRPLLDELKALADEGQFILALSDARGELLWTTGERTVRRRAEVHNFLPGGQWDEASSGTNAIGLALCVGRPVHVFAAEHFTEMAHDWVCYAAPIRDPLSRQIRGVIDLTAPWSQAHSFALAIVQTLARTIEDRLHALTSERAAVLRSYYEAHAFDRIPTPVGVMDASGQLIQANAAFRALLHSVQAILTAELIPIHTANGTVGYVVRIPYTDALDKALPGPRDVELNLTFLGGASAMFRGTPLQLTRRQAEILCLLTLHPEGLSGEVLHWYLYGDAEVSMSTLKAELSRLRYLLDGGISSRPYRITCGYTADFLRVATLLEQGRVREAVHLYKGPLLPEADAPGVVEAREALEETLRQAALAQKDPDALWYLARVLENDLELWETLVALLPCDDPRLAIARARVNLIKKDWF